MAGGGTAIWPIRNPRVIPYANHSQKETSVGIDEATVDHVALLARLKLSDAERKRMQEQMSAILEHINAISQADTSQVPATAHILPVQNVMREDVSETYREHQELLANAPASENEYIRVRAVLENE